MACLTLLCPGQSVSKERLGTRRTPRPHHWCACPAGSHPSVRRMARGRVPEPAPPRRRASDEQPPRGAGGPWRNPNGGAPRAKPSRRRSWRVPVPRPGPAASRSRACRRGASDGGSPRARDPIRPPPLLPPGRRRRQVRQAASATFRRARQADRRERHRRQAASWLPHPSPAPKTPRRSSRCARSVR